MTLEVRIAISPRPSWFNRTRLLMASIRRFYPDALCTVYIGTPEPMSSSVVADAVGQLPHGSLVLVDPKDFNVWAGSANEYVATMAERYKPPFHGDHILMVDADVICVQPFDDFFKSDRLLGVQAHVPAMSNGNWAGLFQRSYNEIPPFRHPYTGAGFMCPAGAYGPWYPNTGVIFGHRDLFEHLAGPYERMLPFLRERLNSYFFEQIALAMAVVPADIPVAEISVRYNFPNQIEFERTFPVDLENITFLHYLRTDTVDRDRDFADWDAVCRFLRRSDLTGSNELLQREVATLAPLVWPAEAAAAAEVETRHA